MTEALICLKRITPSDVTVDRRNMFFRGELDSNNPVKNLHNISQVTEGCVGCEKLTNCELGDTFISSLKASDLQTKISIKKRGNPRLPKVSWS